MAELLVTITITGITLASVVKFFSIEAHHLRSHSFRLEAQQGLRASLDAVTRDIRLAGACLPVGGQFIALDGTDSAAGDSITMRAGLVRPNMSCVLTALNANAGVGATSLQVLDTTGFVANNLVYVRHPQGGGQIVMANAVGGTTITLATGLTQAYPGNVATGNTATVYALDERVYWIDTTDATRPTLTVTINRGAPEAFAVGMQDLQIRYVLDRNCPPCDVVDLPADTTEWSIVNDVVLSGTMRTVGGTLPMDQATLVATSRGKPRNLLP